MSWVGILNIVGTQQQNRILFFDVTAPHASHTVFSAFFLHCSLALATQTAITPLLLLMLHVWPISNTLIFCADIFYLCPFHFFHISRTTQTIFTYFTYRVVCRYPTILNKNVRLIDTAAQDIECSNCGWQHAADRAAARGDLPSHVFICVRLFTDARRVVGKVEKEVSTHKIILFWKE